VRLLLSLLVTRRPSSLCALQTAAMARASTARRPTHVTAAPHALQVRLAAHATVRSCGSPVRRQCPLEAPPLLVSAAAAACACQGRAHVTATEATRETTVVCVRAGTCDRRPRGSVCSLRARCRRATTACAALRRRAWTVAACVTRHVPCSDYQTTRGSGGSTASQCWQLRAVLASSPLALLGCSCTVFTPGDVPWQLPWRVRSGMLEAVRLLARGRCHERGLSRQ
jgi:hypothetical protein